MPNSGVLFVLEKQALFLKDDNMSCGQSERGGPSKSVRPFVRPGRERRVSEVNNRIISPEKT